ncbi:MAG: VWA domain-containing protein [Eubacteriales bacterium]|nr:VWA domain-containing protein [Eubacteriales bacterium]
MPVTDWELFLKKEENNLLLFSEDSTLRYLPSETKQFRFLPKEGLLLLPKDYFEKENYEEDEVLFTIFSALAFYPDWKKNPESYLHRLDRFQKEENEIYQLLERKVRYYQVENEEAYSPKVLKAYIERELNCFLKAIDSYYSLLRVEALWPQFASSEERSRIEDLLRREKVFEDLPSISHTYRGYGISFLYSEFESYKNIPSLRIRRKLTERVLGIKRLSLAKKIMTKQVVEEAPLEERDRFLKTFLLPPFLSLWKKDISRMVMAHQNGKEQTNSKNPLQEENEEESPMQNPEDEKKALSALAEEKKERRTKLQQALNGEKDLKTLGFEEDAIALFHHYETLVFKEREEMKKYWAKLIGESYQEVLLRKPDMTKGRLDPDSLIHHYPSFVEAERKANYKNLPVFEEEEWTKKDKVLPKTIDLSFVIDNSGSMKSGKIEYARKALAIVLLSLEDFRLALEKNAEKTHQKTELRVETYLFGTKSKQVLSFTDKGEKREKGIINSIVTLDGSMGSTNDGTCLKGILDSILPIEREEIRKGKKTKMIFEITDGASSLAGTTKKTVEELTKKGAYLQAIEIGPKDKDAEETFQFIFGEKGTLLGEDLASLPTLLIHKVQTGLESIFRSKE